MNNIQFSKTAYVLFIISMALFAKAQTPNERQLIDSLVISLDTMESDSFRIKSLIKYAFQNRFKPYTRTLVKQAIVIAENQSDENHLGDSYNLYGNFYYYNAKIDSAELMYTKALTFDITPILKANILNALGTCAGKKGTTFKAIELALEAKEILELKENIRTGKEEFQRKGFYGTLLNSLANLYQKIEDYDVAANYYDKAHKVFLEMGEKRSASIILSNKAEMQINLGLFEKALQDQNEAKILKLESEASKSSIAMSDFHIGKAYAGLGELQKAKEIFEHVLEVFSIEKNKTGLSYSHTHYGQLLLELDEIDKAFAQCTKGNQLAIETQDIAYQEKSYQCLYHVLKSQKKFKEALNMHEQYLLVKDSLASDHNIKKVTQLEMQYEYDKEQVTKQVILDAQKRRNKFIVGGLISLLAGISMISYLIFRNYKAKIKSEKILSEKNTIISKALDEKNILLKEIHHRVKNNLQTISSLLNLQSKHVDDKEAISALQEGKNRVKSMALIHENLYQEDNLTGIELKNYFEKLSQSLFNSYNISKNNIDLKMYIEELYLDIDTIIPLGLIVNELITNALKYAFPNGRSGTIWVKMYDKDNALILEVKDNGVGLQDNAESLESSFGYKLIRAFKNKLEAELHVESEEGLKVMLRIKNYKLVS